MTEESVPYPPAPSNVPPYFTKPTASYRVRVIVVLSSLFLFGTLYVGLVAGLGYLCYWSFAGPGQVNVQDLLRDTGIKADNLITIYNNAVEQWQQDQIEDDTFLRILERKVLAPWRAQRRRLDEVQAHLRHSSTCLTHYLRQNPRNFARASGEPKNIVPRRG